MALILSSKNCPKWLGRSILLIFVGRNVLFYFPRRSFVIVKNSFAEIAFENFLS